MVVLRRHWISYPPAKSDGRQRYELEGSPQFAICYDAPKNGFVITSMSHPPLGPYDKLEHAQDALVMLAEHHVYQVNPYPFPDPEGWMALCDGVAVGPVATFEEACRLRLVSEKMTASTQAWDADS